MTKLKVVNLKCGGCETQVRSILEKEGFSSVKVNATNQTISFDGDLSDASEILTKAGYPPADSKQAESLMKKAKSYLSCVLGRTRK